MNLEREWDKTYYLKNAGLEVDAVMQEDGTVTAESIDPAGETIGISDVFGGGVKPDIYSLSEAAGAPVTEKEVGGTQAGALVGVPGALVTGPQDLSALLYGGLQALLAEEGQGVEEFGKGFSAISGAIGSEKAGELFGGLVDKMPIDDETKEAMKRGYLAGEFASMGLATPSVAKAGAGAVADYAAGAPARLKDAKSGVNLGMGVDPTQMVDEAIVGAQKLMGKAPEGETIIKAAPETARGHKTPAKLLIEGTGEKAITPIVQAFPKGNKEAVLPNIDAALANNPDAAKSVAGWQKFAQETMGGDYVPHPPMVAIEYGKSPEKIAEKLQKLTPELKAGVDEGFAFVSEIRDMYQGGQADPGMTADLFVWGILSRGAGPVQQEAAFIDIMQDAAPMMEKVVNGTFDQADLDFWKDNMKKSLPEGSPGKQVTMNVNAAGKLLFELAKRPENSNQTVLEIIHDMVSDPDIPAKEIRRKFMTLTESAGIDNKVVSFILLVAGRDDVLVMDRIQGRHLWDDGRFGGENIYDGIGKSGEGLNGIFKGPRGLLVTEALEDAMRPNIQQAYEMVGRPQDASLGRFHWESWVIEGEQVVSHSTLQAISERTPVGKGVTEGKTDEFASGFRYIRGKAGPVQRYPLSDGAFVYMTPERAKEFLAFVKKPKSGIVPTGFKVTARADVPWYERTEVNRSKLDEAARAYENATPEGAILSGTEGAE